MTRAVNPEGDRVAYSEAEMVSRRQKIAQEIQRGKSDAEIARQLGASRQTVRKVRLCMAEARLHGGEVNHHGKQRGSNPVLTRWSEEQLRSLIKRKHPRDIFPSAKEKQWTPGLLAKLATRRWLPRLDEHMPEYQAADYRVSPSTMRRYMERWAEDDAALSKSREQLILRKAREPYVNASLIWDLLAWTLDNIQTVSNLAMEIGQTPCFAKQVFIALGHETTIYRRITLLRKNLPPRPALPEVFAHKPSALLDPLNTALRRKLRENILHSSNDCERVLLRSEPPGVWSVRLVPVDFASPVVETQLERAKAAADDRKVRDVDVSQTRILAMACDLGNGAYMIELLHAPKNLATLVDSADLARFVGRLLPDILVRGGKLHLPIPGQNIECNAAHEQLKAEAVKSGIAVVEDMPPCFPLTYRPFLRTSDPQAVASMIYRLWAGQRPYVHHDPDGLIAFAPKRPRPRRGRPLKIRSGAD